MPRGPEGKRNPTDVIGNAIDVARITEGEDTDDMPGKNRRPVRRL
jgi:hypothetical protein